LSDAIKTCTGKAKEKNTTINLFMDQSIKNMINAPLIEQAVVNLIDNAIKYSSEGNLVSISANQSNDNMVISITDQGIGIPKEHHDRIFERFYRVDKARSRKLGGTGLGLSIVKNIVAAHNGQVMVESVPGKGSTFKIILPMMQKI
jgi:two-component system, OmpR family, phosphate regulon sensor histidine kinase PhoR